MGNTGSNTGNMGNTGYGSANPGAMGNTGSTTPGSTGSSNTGTSNTPGSSTGQGSTSSQGTMNQGTPGQGMTNQGSTNQGSAADTTGQNAGSATSTPVQQGNSKAELAITASIHRDLARSRSLSATAKTVKVITYGTTVTLRGPVSSDTDRTTIENLARQTPGVTDVDDQLVVKGNTK
jgi:osmotically-inducible protein OsmY